MELKGGDCVGIRFARVVLGGAARAGLYVGRACLDHSRLEPCMYVCMYICIFFKLELLHEGHFGQFTTSAAGSVEHQLAVGAACPAGDSEEVDCNALSFVSFRVIGLLHFREAACC